MTVAVPRVSLVLLILLNLLRTPAWAQAPTALNITIIEGEGAINNVRQRVNREPIVQVEDQNHKPVAGAVVIFLLPDQGAGGTFPGGSHMLMTVTDNQGRATARGIRPNNQNGPLQIRVNASFQGLTATNVIAQTNLAGAAAASGFAGLSTAAKVLIIVGVAGGAAAAGAIVATHTGGSSSSSPPTVTLSPGTPTVGGPGQ